MMIICGGYSYFWVKNDYLRSFELMDVRDTSEFLVKSVW